MAKVECKPWSGVTTPEMECGRVEVKHTITVEIFQRYLQIKCAYTAADMAHKYVEEHSTNKVILLEEFKCHTALFSEEEAN